MSEDKKGEHCEICGKFMEGYEYEMCCNGFECECMGRPVEPCICSNKCWDQFTKPRQKSPFGIIG